MPNVFKFNTSTDEKSLRKGNFSIGVGDVAKGRSVDTGFYNGITPPQGGWTIYHRRGDGNNFGIYTASTSNLVSLTNQLDGKTFTQVWECLNHFSGTSSRVVLNKDFAPMVTDGLILMVDPSNTISYPSTGSTLYDLSGNNYNASLINSPVHNSDSFFSFDGFNSYASFDYIGLRLPPTTDRTLEIWAKVNNYPAIQGGLIAGQKNSTGALMVLANGRFSWYWDDSLGVQSTTTLTLNTWFQIVILLRNSYYCTYYVNGKLDKEEFQTSDTFSSQVTVWAIGRQNRDFSGDFYYLDCDVSIHRQYSKNLSESEIIQNYYGGPIVTSGLIMALDAGNLVSYSGSGTTWNDLSGNGNNVTLYNSPTYSNGFLIGDGTSAYARTTNTLNLTNLSSITIIVVFKVPSTSSGGILYEHTNNWNNTGNYGGVSYGGFGVAVNSNGSTTTANTNHHQLRGNSNYSGANVVSPDNTKFQHYTTIHNFSAGSGSETVVYINGSLVNSSFTYSANNTSTFADDYLYLWSRGGNTSFSNATLGFVYVYNRALSPSEILQNYGAAKWRFGL